MKKRFPVIMLAFTLGAWWGPVQAIDEDYCIPYTDTYGYKYDPETGTYIKEEPPAAVDTPSPQPHPTGQETGAGQLARLPDTGKESGFAAAYDTLILAIGVFAALGLGMVLVRRIKR